MRRRVGVLISGRGSNMLALAEAARRSEYPADIVMVLSNRPDAPGLAAAHCLGLATRCVDHRPFRGQRAHHDAAVARLLDETEVELVCLAGYMRLLTPGFVQRYAGRMLNIHPSLLPAFPGLHTHAQALAAGVRLHGCTVHLVTEKMDRGPILGQAAVPVLAGDTEDRLAARVLVQELRLYPAVLAAFIRGQDGSHPQPDACLANPLPLSRDAD